MIVFYRNGVRTVVTGWRAWLLMIAAAVILVVVVCLTLGFALTLLTLALFALPVAIVLALLAQVFQSPRR
jgi:succinate dehydrogenase hydrophobic anchor subunit